MVIPSQLAAALEKAFDKRSLKELARKAESIRLRYRGEGAVRESFTSSDEVLSYLAFRFPATYAAACSVFARVAERDPSFAPVSMLDLGAGPATAGLAALEQWPGLKKLVFVEKHQAAIDAGKLLMQSLFPQHAGSVEWKRADITGGIPQGPFDLAYGGYALNELPDAKVPGVIQNLQSSAIETLVLVEPSISARVSLLVETVRRSMQERGYKTLAPCTHELPCPRREKNWCHFAQRLSRPGFLRIMKEGEQPFEDEKFLYAVMTRRQFNRPGGVLTRQPIKRKGHVVLEICSELGVQNITLGRSSPLYKAAKKLGWGDALYEPDDPHMNVDSEE